jgi:hypothetical protein
MKQIFASAAFDEPDRLETELNHQHGILTKICEKVTSDRLVAVLQENVKFNTEIIGGLFVYILTGNGDKSIDSVCLPDQGLAATRLSHQRPF